MGGRRCVEVTPGVGEERNPVSPSAEVRLSAVYLSPLIPGMMSSGKTSLPSRKVRLTGQVIRACEEVGRGCRKMLIKGEEKSQLSPGAFPSSVDLLSRA